MSTTPIDPNKDAKLKKEVLQILSNCNLHKVTIDREVALNLSGDTNASGVLESEVEIDVVVSFYENAKKNLLLFECEDTTDAGGVKKEYRERHAFIKDLKDGKYPNLKIVGSKDGQLSEDNFKKVDNINACYVYGDRFKPQSLQTCEKEAQKYSFVVWGSPALKYYKKITSILKDWTKYELYKEFGFSFQKNKIEKLDAIHLIQKGQTDGMYLAKIHPGQLLKIAYVVRRTSKKSFAYQRMLNKQRIQDIARFIDSTASHALLPNTLIIVFDNNPEIQDEISFNASKNKLSIPMEYCSAWIIDGQHRAYGFIGTKYEKWGDDNHEAFDLPVVIFKNLEEVVQTQTFIDINYNQKKIKPDLLCDLATVTQDLNNPLTWVSLLGIELNKAPTSPLKDKIKVSEFDTGTLSLSSLVKYGLLETLLGYKQASRTYTGTLFTFSPFKTGQQFMATDNQTAFQKQLGLVSRFLVAVKNNTSSTTPDKDPWTNTKDYSLIKPTGINALFLLLSRVLQKHPQASFDFNDFLKPLKNVDFSRKNVADKGTGWQGFRQFANEMIKEINKSIPNKADQLALFGDKDKS
ncbi:MAG: DGQHR domain-containing protein [Minisyncoccia bacterium]